MKARTLVVAAVVVLLAAGAAAWCLRDTPAVADAARVLGLSPATPPTLQAAGVHKCVGARGTVYSDGPCAAGSREVAASGGAVTVMAFPKVKPVPAAAASGLLVAPLVAPMDAAERDRLRDKAIDDAMNRK